MEAVATLDVQMPARSEAVAPARSEKELIDATRRYSAEDRSASWMHTFVAFALMGATEAVALTAPYWELRLAAAVVTGLLTIRVFILYHDYLHGAILRGSAFARALFYTYGVLVLTPPRVWKQTHNYHHAHTAKLVGSHVGSYPTVNTEIWRMMTGPQRLAYKAMRHPLTILFGYFTVFLSGMCMASFVRNPRKNWDSLLAVVVHVTLGFLLWHFGGADMFWFGLFAPLFVSCAMGGYLFYAQHNFPGMHIQPRESWTHARASLESSSYMKLGPVMNWLTGNIGFHHVHHLNPTIPFYRLPEAMEAIPELQHPGETSLGFKDIIACFRLKIWDSEQQKMVGYPS